jgi:hypothetical protein
MQQPTLGQRVCVLMRITLKLCSVTAQVMLLLFSVVVIESDAHGNSIMIDFEQSKKDISTWIETVLSEPQPQLNGISRCPFAAPALANDRVSWTQGHSVAEDIAAAIAAWHQGLEIAVLIYDAAIDAVQFSQAVEAANHDICQSQGFIALEDHPENLEHIAGLIMNQGQYALVLLAPAAKLHKASQMLRTRGYYANWTQQDLENVVNWRWSC